MNYYNCFQPVNIDDLPGRPNQGKGVYSIAMKMETSINYFTRVSKALAFIGKADGL